MTDSGFVLLPFHRWRILAFHLQYNYKFPMQGDEKVGFGDGYPWYGVYMSSDTLLAETRYIDWECWLSTGLATMYD